MKKGVEVSIDSKVLLTTAHFLLLRRRFQITSPVTDRNPLFLREFSSTFVIMAGSWDLWHFFNYIRSLSYIYPYKSVDTNKHCIKISKPSIFVFSPQQRGHQVTPSSVMERSISCRDTTASAFPINPEHLNIKRVGDAQPYFSLYCERKIIKL